MKLNIFKHLNNNFFNNFERIFNRNQQHRTYVKIYFLLHYIFFSYVAPSAVSPNKSSAPLLNNQRNRSDSSQSESSSAETATSGTSSPIRNTNIKPTAAVRSKMSFYDV